MLSFSRNIQGATNGKRVFSKKHKTVCYVLNESKNKNRKTGLSNSPDEEVEALKIHEMAAKSHRLFKCK